MPCYPSRGEHLTESCQQITSEKSGRSPRDEAENEHACECPHHDGQPNDSIERDLSFEVGESCRARCAGEPQRDRDPDEHDGVVNLAGAGGLDIDESAYEWAKNESTSRATAVPQ